MKKTSKTIFNEFMIKHYKESYGIRDNCGFAAIDLVLFFESHGIPAQRVQGYFKCDIQVHNKRDFTKEMKIEFLESGLDFNSKSDRLSWLANSKYSEEWRLCPHYWVECEGQIFDPSGEAQFIASGLASDLDENRYIKK